MTLSFLFKESINNIECLGSPDMLPEYLKEHATTRNRDEVLEDCQSNCVDRNIGGHPYSGAIGPAENFRMKVISQKMEQSGRPHNICITEEPRLQTVRDVQLSVLKPVFVFFYTSYAMCLE